MGKEKGKEKEWLTVLSILKRLRFKVLYYLVIVMAPPSAVIDDNTLLLLSLST